MLLKDILTIIQNAINNNHEVSWETDVGFVMLKEDEKLETAQPLFLTHSAIAGNAMTDTNLIFMFKTPAVLSKEEKLAIIVNEASNGHMDVLMEAFKKFSKDNETN